jgi:hypothetical protein
MVDKGVGVPKGLFTITVGDRPAAVADDTVYAQIAPMDYIEIRMASEPHVTGIPLVMRGFVTAVSRQESIGESGQPQRSVVIHGADTGKILEMIQFYYGVGYATGQIISSAFALFQRFQLMADSSLDGAISVKDFFQRVIDEVVNPYLLDMADARLGAMVDGGEGDLAVANADVLQLGTDIVDTGDFLYWISLGSYQGTLWGLLARDADLAWHEMFVEDREEGPFFVYRPMPFLSVDGELIQQPGVYMPEVIERSHDDMKSLSVSRSDASVANIFDVQAPKVLPMMQNNWSTQMLVQDDGYVYMRDHDANLPSLYGDRRLAVVAQQAPAGFPSNLGSMAAEEVSTQEESMIQWGQRRRRALAEMAMDNVLWESGTAVFRGDPLLRAGRYLRLRRQDMQQQMYMVHVRHEFTPFSSYVTTVNFIRGDGWIRRQGYDMSPDLNERSAGPYRE